MSAKLRSAMVLSGLGLILGSVAMGCASVPPPALLDARAAYQRASTSSAAQLTPAQLHVAQQSLALAESTFEDEGDTDKTRDRAYVATSRLAQGNHPRARDTLTHLQEEWAAVILEAVGDPAVARAVLLIGDGLYYNSALQPWLGGSAPADDALDALIHVVDDLVRLRSARG